MTFNLEEENKKIDRLVEWIEEQNALMRQFPVYDPDVDLEEVTS